MEDFGVILHDLDGWETDNLSNNEPDLEAPPSPSLTPTVTAPALAHT
jgi:hypothetical protein